jgi:hypothetical protein
MIVAVLLEELIRFREEKMGGAIMKTFKAALTVTAVLMLLVGMQSRVHAAAELSLSDGIFSVLAIDNVQNDTNPLLGVIGFNGGIGPNWLVDVTTGLTKPAQGSAANPSMDLNSVNLSTGAANLQIKFSDVDFTGVGGATFQVGGTTEGTVTAEAFYSGTNAFFAETVPIGTLLTFNSTPFSGQTAGSISPNFYSLTIDVNIAHAAAVGGISSFNANLAMIPEPTTSLVLGFGLVGLFGLRRRVTK